MLNNIIVVVCTHTGSIFAECAASLISNINTLSRSAVFVSFKTVLKEAYPARAKSTAVKYLLEDPHAQALVIIDYDLGFDPTGIARLLLADKDIVSGAFPFKDGEGYPVIVNNKTINKDGLVEAVSITSGFTLIKRNVFDEMESKLNIRSSEGLKFFFDTGFLFEDDPRWYGEDRSFCRRARECGLKMWIEPYIMFAHIGLQGKNGCYADYIGVHK